MGYRSTMAFYCKPEILPHLVALLDQHAWISYANLYQDGSAEVIINDIKWYDSYDTVQLINNFVASHPTLVYATRAGEEDDDFKEYNEPLLLDCTTIKYMSSQALITKLKQTNPEAFI